MGWPKDAQGEWDVSCSGDSTVCIDAWAAILWKHWAAPEGTATWRTHVLGPARSLAHLACPRWLLLSGRLRGTGDDPSPPCFWPWRKTWWPSQQGPTEVGSARWHIQTGPSFSLFNQKIKLRRSSSVTLSFSYHYSWEIEIYLQELALSLQSRAFITFQQ